MFVIYLWRELRRRARQAALVAAGMAVGIGLVITVAAASTGVRNAQGTVLHSLYGIGTDMTVTKAAARGSGGASRFSFGGGLPLAGHSFRKHLLLSGSAGLGTLSTGAVSSIARLPHVSAVTGALVLNELDISGTMPGITLGPGGASRSKTSISTNSFSVFGASVIPGSLGPLSSSKLVSGRAFSVSDAHANLAVLSADYARQHKLHLGSRITIGDSNGHGTHFTVIGLVQAPPGSASAADVYIPLARAQALGAVPQGGAALTGKVNTIYIAATSAAQIASVQRAVGGLLPRATVTTSSDLARQVTGSLASTSSLASSFGRWLAVAVLAAAFLLASLLTMSAVSRRVREFGTLKALGWRGRRIVGQVLGESIALGILGGLAGVGLGFGGAALVKRLAPPLTATVGQPSTPSSVPGRPLGSQILQRMSQNQVHTVSVHLSAPVTTDAIVAAVVLAVVGGLLSGALGGWRAARLRPAAALARVE
ncbi:MAG: ABC transporter permease [Streptosporangiaceae bacterium]